MTVQPQQHKHNHTIHEPTKLEIHKASSKGGYYLRHPDNGIVFWGLTGEITVEHLLLHYPGSMVVSYCEFEAGPYGRVEGSEDSPLILEWDSIH